MPDSLGMNINLMDIPQFREWRERIKQDMFAANNTLVAMQDVIGNLVSVMETYTRGLLISNEEAQKYYLEACALIDREPIDLCLPSEIRREIIP